MHSRCHGSELVCIQNLLEHGAEIKGVYYISRDEQFPSLRENADFSIDTVKASIRQGELKTNHILNEIKLS